MLDTKVTHFTLTIKVRCEHAYCVREQHTSPYLASCTEFQKNISQEKNENAVKTYGNFSSFSKTDIQSGSESKKFLKSDRIGPQNLDPEQH